jgi:serine/threonine protein kinase
MNFTKDNIEDICKQTSYTPSRSIQKSIYFPTYEIERTLLQKINDNKNYQIFKIVNSNKIDYYVTEFKLIGRGGYGFVFEGVNIITKEIIAIKYGHIKPNEIISLIKIGFYIAHMDDNLWDDILLMKRAQGVSYDNILRNKSISDQTKIKIHKEAIKKIIELGNKYNIYHGDTDPRHVFVENNNNDNNCDYKITLIDFGNSRHVSDLNFFIKCDIDMFNQNTKYLSSYCGKSFCDYIESLHDIEYVRSSL